jgi:hypothetical protein
MPRKIALIVSESEAQEGGRYMDTHMVIASIEKGLRGH